jgi:integrase
MAPPRTGPTRLKLPEGKPKSEALKIKNVYAKGGRWYLVKRIDRRKVWIGLSLVADGAQRLTDSLKALEHGAVITVGDLLKAYLRDGTGDLRPATLKGYTAMCEPYAPLMWTFGKVRTGSLTTADVAKYLEKRKKAGRSHGGNRERAVLSAAYEFGMRNGYAASNPSRGVRRNKEKPRTRYVTTEELQAAITGARPEVQELLYAALLTGLRQADLLALRLSDLRGDGIHLCESKTGRARIISWSPELRKLVEGAVERSRRLQSNRQRKAAERSGVTPPAGTVFTGRSGQPWTLWAVQSVMRRLNVDWHFHDLRAKAATDADHQVLGRHSTLGTYLRGERTKPTM